MGGWQKKKKREETKELLYSVINFCVIGVQVKWIVELFKIGETQQSQVQKGEQWSVSFSCWSDEVLVSSYLFMLFSFGTSTQGIAVRTKT